MSPTFSLTTNHTEETRRLGQLIGQWVTAGTVIPLTGDLGSGKTVFVKGLARGLAVPPDHYITSPTYTLINDYPGRIPLYHVDLYRLSSVTEVEDIGLPDILSGPFVTAIEWAGRLPAGYFGDHLAIDIRFSGNDARQFVLTAYGRSSQILLRKVQQKYEEPLWD